MSTLQQPGEPAVQVRPPEEALRAALPLPARERLVIEDVSDREWAAFAEALADA